MKILIKCSCGKILYVSSKYAGKKGKCPQCQRTLIVPEKTKQDELPKKSCPTCGSFLNPKDNVCITCKTNLKTGEWNTTKIEKKHKLLYDIIFLFILFITSFLIYLSLDKKEKIVIKNKTLLSEQTNKDLSNLILLKENNIKFKEEKIEHIDKLLEKYSNEEKYRSLCEIIKIKNKLEKDLTADSELEKFRKFEKNIAKQQNQFIILLEYYYFKENTKNNIIKININKRIKNIEKDIEIFLDSHKEKLNQLFQEKRYVEVISRATPKFLEVLYTPLCPKSKKLKKNWESVISFYKKAATKRSVAPTPLKNKARELAILEEYKHRFNGYIKTFYERIFNREYNKAQQELESFWESVYKLETIESDNFFLLQIKKRLKEVQSVKALLSIANEGAKDSVGLKRPLFLKTGKIIMGDILKYELENFFVKSRSGDIIKLPLLNLRAEDIVFFALKYKKDKYTYQFAGLFYLFERKYSLSQKCFTEALLYGSDPSEIKKYLEINKDFLAKMDKKETKVYRKNLFKIRQEKKLKQNWQKAVSLLPSVIKKFKKNEDIDTLVYLEKLQKYLDYEHIKKLNQKFTEDYGLNLSEITNKCLIHCRKCNNTGWLLCPFCAGSGYTKKAAASSINSQNCLCNKCLGKGYIKCQFCDKKRRNRRWIILASFYAKLVGGSVPEDKSP